MKSGSELRITQYLNRTLFSFALLCLAPIGEAASTACPALFAKETAPDLLSAQIGQKTKPLCFQTFGVLYSGIALGPLWSAEHLTKAGVDQARGLVRVDHFHEEPQLSAMPHATLADFARSGFDRGHMSPNGDMPDTTAQFQSFSLANMVPQSPPNNRGVWAGIEAVVRDMASRDGEVYVVTGPIYEGSQLQKLNGRVLVPSYLFKAVYNPKHQAAAAYITANAPGSEYKVVSIAALQQRVHIDPFPGLPAAIKNTALTLPAPTESHHASIAPAKRVRAAADKSSDQSLWDWFDAELMRWLKQLSRAL